MENKYKIAISESTPYMVVLIVIGLGLYLNSLIVVDTITIFVAEIIGYGLLTGLIAMEILQLILLKVKEVEKAQLLQTIRQKDDKIEDQDEKIKDLERELRRQKALG